MNKTSYEKEGLNSLNELFEKLIKCSEENDTKGTMRIVSSLTEEEKDYMYSWAKEQNNLAKVAGIVVEAEMAKKAFDINCRFKKTLCEALVQNGYCLEGDPDVYNSDSFPFTDNKYINGEVIFDTRKVQLKARDAENRKYEKTIDYSSVGDLIESINHFRKDIEETFEKPEVVEEVVKEEPFDILNDKEFMKQIGADWAVNLAKKAGTETYKDIGWTIEKNNDGYIVRNENGYIVHTPFNTEEEAEKYINEPVKPNYVKTDGYPIFDGRKKASIEGGLEKKAGFSNNPNYFGDWYGEGQIDFSKIIDPESSGDVYMVKLWGGRGYILDVYLVKAEDYEEALNKVLEWSYNNEGKNNVVFDRDYLEKRCKEDYNDEYYYGSWGKSGKPADTEDYESFEEQWMQEWVGDSNYELFARSENLFVDKVPEKYLKDVESNSEAHSTPEIEEKLEEPKEASQEEDIEKKAGFSNNPNYFGDWYGEGQIDFSKIIDPESSGDVYMVKLWGGRGYILDVYLVKAEDYEEALNKVLEWSYNNEGKNNVVFDRDYLEKRCKEDYNDEYYYGSWGKSGKPADTEDYESFEEQWMQEWVGDSNYELFARSENLFVDKVPEKYLKDVESNSEAHSTPEIEEKLEEPKEASQEEDIEKKADSNPKNAEELKRIYSNIYDGVNRMPALEIDDTNIIYFEPQGNQIVWGGITNAGLIPDYTFDYDYDLSFDSNIQYMTEQVIEQEKNK